MTLSSEDTTMQPRSGQSLASTLLAAFILLAVTGPSSRADELPPVLDVEFQPLSAQARRVAESLVMLGEPLGRDEAARLEKALDSTGGEPAIRAIQEVLDRRCLIGVNINPESRVKAVQGPAAARLVQNGWSVFLVKVHNEAGVTAQLAAESPNALPVYRQFTGRPDPKPSVRPFQVVQRWMDLAMYNDRPMMKTLRGSAWSTGSSRSTAGMPASGRRRSASTSARGRRTWASAAMWTCCSRPNPA